MLSNEVTFALAINPGQMDGALALDVTDSLRNSQFWRNRNHHVYVIRHEMLLHDLSAFLCRKLTKHIAQMPSQRRIQGLAPTFRDKNNVEFAVPNRVT